MATEREVIREFLVSLGFQIDEVSGKKFASTLLGVTKLAGQTSATIMGIVVAGEAMVQRFSHGMEKLYYSSQRTKQPVASIRALEYAAEQVGVSADAARGAIERMQLAMRMNPGLKALLKNLGVDPESKNLLIDFTRQMTKLPFYIASQWGQQFGIDPETLLMMIQKFPELEANAKRWHELQRQAGIDSEQAAAAGREYMNTLRQIWERIQLLHESLSIKLLPAFREFMGVVNEVISDLMDLKSSDFDMGTWGGQLKEIITDLKELGKQLGGIVKDYEPEMKAFLWVIMTGAKNAASALLDLVDALLAVTSGNWTKAWDKLKSAGRNLIAAPKSAAEIELDRVLSLPPGATTVKPGIVKSAGPTGAKPSGFPGAQPPAGTPARPAEPSITSPRPGQALPLGLSQNNPGNLRSWGAAAVRNGFAVFSSMQEGLSAMAGNLLAYARRGWDSISTIIGKWAPPGENNTEAYVMHVAQQMGVGKDSKLNLTDPQTLASLMGAIIKHEQGYNPFGTGQLMAAANTRLGSNVVINQTTTINVSGEGAKDTAKEVANHQDRVNGNIVRNMVGVVQ